VGQQEAIKIIRLTASIDKRHSVPKRPDHLAHFVYAKGCVEAAIASKRRKNLDLAAGVEKGRRTLKEIANHLAVVVNGRRIDLAQALHWSATVKKSLLAKDAVTHAHADDLGEVVDGDSLE